MPQTHPWALRKGNKVRTLERVRAFFQPSLRLELLRLIVDFWVQVYEGGAYGHGGLRSGVSRDIPRATS